MNINMIGPHRMWRARLMEAFMPGEDAVIHNDWKPAKEADRALMSEMCDEQHKRPYHILNTNIILCGSEHVKYRSRGGDNFIISRLYCGSDATEWQSTENFQSNSGRGITLATAMATSAAALNPDAGVSGDGITRNVAVSLLLSTLNLRLGYWTSNPKNNRKISSPNFFFPGAWTEILRQGFNEKSADILLSDGGHFENLGLYELIRRRATCIIVCDGGADPGFNFDDLANAVEKVRVDFGAKITFKPEFGLDDLLPGSAKDDGLTEDYVNKYGVAKRGFAVADVTYSGDVTPSGLLYFVKLTMIPGLPTDVYSYKGLHPEFPHQSTVDQFFDEKQFEAYRELGYYIAWQMMDWTVDKDGKRIPANVEGKGTKIFKT